MTTHMILRSDMLLITSIKNKINAIIFNETIQVTGSSTWSSQDIEHTKKNSYDTTLIDGKIAST